MEKIEIIKPDDWHVHIREGEMLKAVTKFSSRVNHRCIVMPNLEKPIINSILALEYIEKINTNINILEFKPLLPCYLTDNLDLIDFQNSLENNIFFGAKLYPSNVTTNSRNGVSKIENIFFAHNKPLFSSMLCASPFLNSLNLIPNSFSKSAISLTSSS